MPAETVLRLEPQEVLVRLVVAALVGALVGLERQRRNHPAGLRTHTLVCLGSALVMVMSEDIAARYIHLTNADPARIAAQVVSGIGFLGAGTIMREGLTVRGLTTAASLWVVASLGLAVGGGYYLAAGTATLLSLITLGVLNQLEHALWDKGQYGRLQLFIQDRAGQVGAVASELGRLHVGIKSIHIEPAAAGELIMLEFTVCLPHGMKAEELMAHMMAIPGVARMEFEAA